MQTINTPVIAQFDDLCFAYPQRPLFEGLSARMHAGVTLVCGGDGAGKTTLLRLLSGVLPAQAGVLQVNGVVLSQQPHAYRQQVFWTEPQSTAFDQITPVDYFETVAQSHPALDRTQLAALTFALSLDSHLGKPLYMLSTGSRRKVWLAAAMASGAALTLLDDPFAALDQRSIAVVTEVLKEAAADLNRAWVVAHYAAPAGVALAGVINLGD